MKAIDVAGAVVGLGAAGVLTYFGMNLQGGTIPLEVSMYGFIIWACALGGGAYCLARCFGARE